MYVIINDTKYDIPELDFNSICELEENGIYLLNMDRKDRKYATMVRGLVAWVMKTDVDTASMEIQQHIEKGGNIADIMARITQAINTSSFFNSRQKSKDGSTVTEIPQNREQRRKQSHEKNTSPTQN